jgi:endonuclease/exonuclease/phosphatase family metal-dependent hydrolase
VNTHFDFDPGVQAQSAGLVMDFLAAFPRDLPVIILGDFNAEPGSLAHERFRSQGFHLVFDHENITTFHGFTGKKTGKFIDWILYRGLLSLGSCQVITDSFSGRFPSDHYPVRAVFDL